MLNENITKKVEELFNYKCDVNFKVKAIKIKEDKETEYIYEFKNIFIAEKHYIAFDGTGISARIYPAYAKEIYNPEYIVNEFKSAVRSSFDLDLDYFKFVA